MTTKIAAILATGLLVGLLFRINAPNKVFSQQTQKNLSGSFSTNATDGFKMAATFVDIIFAVKRSNTLIIDTRAKSMYAEGHIISAVNAPTREELVEKLTGLRKGTQAIIYGRRADPRVYDLVRSAQVSPEVSVQVYEGGWNEWTNLGLNSFSVSTRNEGPGSLP